MSADVSSPAGVPSSGLIDIHSHLLPGVDDGCYNIDESIACVRRLRAAGFVGSVCTPHMAIDVFPGNTIEHVRARTLLLERRLAEAGLDYRIWPGGELRLTREAVAWVEAHGVPTLAGSRCVLMDAWGPGWTDWIDGVLEWFFNHGYQPILAHPERMYPDADLLPRFAELQRRGLWLQGNVGCMTGEEGAEPDRTVRQLLAEDRYRFLALDMHGPETLESRLDGLRLVEAEFGSDTIGRLMSDAPRQLLARG